MTTEQGTESVSDRLRRGRENAKRARTVTNEQMLAAANANNIQVTEEDVFALQQRSSGGATAVAERTEGVLGARVTHETVGKVWMYKHTPQGFVPRQIVAANIGMAIRSGWLAACPDCGQAGCGVDGDMNSCTGRAPRKYGLCPIASCHKRFWDTLELEPVEPAETRDPNAVDLNLASRSTPEQRIWTEISAHLMGYHPKEAPQYGAVPVTVTAQSMQPIIGTEAGKR